MFIGREKELALLQQDYIGKAVMVYGKRRVGKTTLIQKALKSSGYRTVYFECLKGTMQDNINGLVQELNKSRFPILPRSRESCLLPPSVITMSACMT